MLSQIYTHTKQLNAFSVGVGLRSQHYNDAFENKTSSKPDFVEIHAENFFAKGGISRAILDKAQHNYALSIHGTGMGLGSYAGIDMLHVNKFKQLVERYQPALISDHAAFALGNIEQQIIHAGDILPIEFSQKTLRTFEGNLNRVQDSLGRILLIENICSYIPKKNSELSETEFLVELCHRTGCGLLIDLNNLVVNAVNQQAPDIPAYVEHWLQKIPPAIVGQYHLAGCSPVTLGEIMVDDHSTKVTPEVWRSYAQALKILGPRPTLIEWDTDLPSWNDLLHEAEKAKQIAREVLVHE